jgi:hypothetical protein
VAGVAGELTPAELWALAAKAEQLAGDLESAQAALRGAADEPTCRVGFRLDDGAGTLRRVAEEINQTAEDLSRIRSRQVPERASCSAEWGVCPEHGNTLSSSGGRSQCRTPGCSRSWDWDRGGLPCTELAAWRVVDTGDKEILLCAGHALDARQRLEGAQLLPIEGTGR